MSIRRIRIISGPITRPCCIIGFIISSLVGGVPISRLRLMSRGWDVCIVGTSTSGGRRTLSQQRNWLGVIAMRPWTIHLSSRRASHVMWAGLG